MATLLSLPNELLGKVCHELYPRDGEFDDPVDRLGRLSSLAALAHTSRRLQRVTEPVLYHRGVEHHWPRPLAWAAKRGYEDTLTKALAAGADPDRKMEVQITRQLLRLVNDTHQAAMDWSNNDAKFWPAFHLLLDEQGGLPPREQEWARGMTPTGERFHVFLPSYRSPVDDPHRHGAGHGSNTQASPASCHPLFSASFETDSFALCQYTALHLAAREGHTHIVNRLLDHGASFNVPSHRFCPCASSAGLWQAFLEPPAWSDSLFPRSWSPLHVAICSSRIEVAKCLIERGAAASVVPYKNNAAAGYDALHQAAAAGHADLVVYILDRHRGLDINARDNLGLTAFYHAYANCRWDSTVPLLLARGADINSRFRLHGGVAKMELLELTSLGEACRLGRFEDAMRLIDLGADVSIGLQELRSQRPPSPSDDLGPPPRCTHIPLLHVCCMDFSRRDQEMFPSKDNTWRPAQLQKAFRSKVIAKLLAAAGSGLDAQWDPGDSRTETPLSVAVRHSNIPVVKMLLAAGADPNARDSKGRNALMIAIEEPSDQRAPHGGLMDNPKWGFLPGSQGPPSKGSSDKWAVVKLLLDAGVAVNEADAEGDTALHMLLAGCRYRWGGNWAPLPPPERWMTPSVEGRILRLLLARDADACLMNSSGASALRLAVGQGNSSAVEAIACQRPVDLVRDLPMDEIVAIFDAVPYLQTLTYRSSAHKPELVEADTAGLHLLNTLVDMDGTGRLSSNVPFICSRLLQCIWLPSSLELAEILCFRGLDRGSFDAPAKLELLRTAVSAGSWDVARVLLRDIPPTEINALDPGGQSLLSLSLAAQPHLYRTAPDNNPIFGMLHLLDLGADIHQPVSPTLPHGDDTTPLKRAVLSGNRYPIERMLLLQPLAGNPAAMRQRYLHWAVALPWRADERRCEPAEAEDVIRVLLRAGADPAELDDDGDTPVLIVLRELAGKTDLLRKVYHWLKPLSRGVDVNHRNKEGRSVVDYLRTIMDSGVGFLSEVLRLDRVADGKGEKTVLVWLK